MIGSQYLDSLLLFATNSLTSPVAQLGAHCIAVLHFLGLNPGRVMLFFYIIIVMSFVINFIIFYFAPFLLTEKNIKA